MADESASGEFGGEFLVAHIQVRDPLDQGQDERPAEYQINNPGGRIPKIELMNADPSQ
jgi:hypothetical protein